MKKYRVFSLANEIGISTTELIKYLKELGIEVKGNLSTIDEENANIVKDLVLKDKESRTKREKEVKGNIKIVEICKHLNISFKFLIPYILKWGLVRENINEEIPFPVAARICNSFKKPITDILPPLPKNYKTRPPIVTVMGHIDHGKTTLLDSIRKTNIALREKGGITQKIGASEIEFEGKKIIFIDTPGHEAFTEMRIRGSFVTDIVILVVAADEGAKEQTIEALNHAKAANVPIIVAVNKIDKEGADPDKVRQQMANYNLLPEEWGGETIFVNTSAKTGIGINELLENIILISEIEELSKSDEKRPGGTVIEAKLDPRVGPTANLILQAGELKCGDWIMVGETYGKVRMLTTANQKQVKEVEATAPVEIIGLKDTPLPGEILIGYKSEGQIKEKIEKLEMAKKEKKQEKPISLDDLFEKLEEEKKLNLVLKTDTYGSLEAIKSVINSLDTGDIKIEFVHTGVGSINESDILLATASNAIILGFNTKENPMVKKIPERSRVKVFLFDLIYELQEWVVRFVKGMVKPEFVENTIGKAEVKQVFDIGGLGLVAGSIVREGKIVRDANAKVFRGSKLIGEGKVSSLKRFKDDVKEVLEGYECGIRVEGVKEINEGDIIEVYELKEKGS
ncbi:MAG TPA: translation initiation factor IF-2 [Caldisericia bacterium]|nr:translation initiation factor IF-2 [Caldisericia bacterium]HOL83104.1 translation initiation factor IF-2 [Caldisericia bacterium]HPP43245.1 translation initiation factor IF-2 [Caldisericia bacterium]HRT37032.1 translation initiation factor IF-2 [Caldisericia bacterium]